MKMKLRSIGSNGHEYALDRSDKEFEFHLSPVLPNNKLAGF